MTPLQINIVLHVYAIVTDYRDSHAFEHADSRAVKESLLFLAREGIIETQNPDWDFGYPIAQHRLTERGHVYVEALKALPLPVKSWRMPGAEK